MKLAHTVRVILAALYLSTPLLLSPAAFAQPASSAPKAALAEELLLLFELDKNMETAFAQVAAMQEKLVTAKGTPEQQARQKQGLATAMEETKKVFTWEKMKPSFVKIYADVFSEEELQSMITFFKTPIGQAWIAKQPQLQAATMAEMQTLMMEVQAKVMDSLKAQPGAQPGVPGK